MGQVTSFSNISYDPSPTVCSICNYCNGNMVSLKVVSKNITVGQYQFTRVMAWRFADNLIIV